MMMSHQWPGNVRELENVIARAVTLTSAPAHFRGGVRDDILPRPRARAAGTPPPRPGSHPRKRRSEGPPDGQRQPDQGRQDARHRAQYSLEEDEKVWNRGAAVMFQPCSTRPGTSCSSLRQIAHPGIGPTGRLTEIGPTNRRFSHDFGPLTDRRPLQFHS